MSHLRASENVAPNTEAKVIVSISRKISKRIRYIPIFLTFMGNITLIKIFYWRDTVVLPVSIGWVVTSRLRWEKLICKLVLLLHKSAQVKNVAKTNEQHLINPRVNCKANLDAKLADRPITLELFYDCSNSKRERQLFFHKKVLKGNHIILSSQWPVYRNTTAFAVYLNKIMCAYLWLF